MPSSPGPEAVNTPSPSNPEAQAQDRSKRKRGTDGHELTKSARSKVDHPTSSRSDPPDEAIQCAKPAAPPSEESGSLEDNEDEYDTRLSSEESDPEEESDMTNMLRNKICIKFYCTIFFALA
ncbi:hypothetical protein FRB90_009058 [Tulasnella sp. 427]|nr:hypothetical protein FRB90_009058 [Tulasnella sp. 427]